MGSVLVAARGARLVNAAHFLRTESRPSLAGRDGPDDGDAGDHHADRENCHQDRWGHDSRSVVRTTKKHTPRPLSADVARSSCGPAYGEDHIPPVSCPLDGTAARPTAGGLADAAAYVVAPVLTQAAIAHAQFETIHPFPDGNGRVGRALVHALLKAGGLARSVTVPVSAGLLGDTGTYFAALTAYRAGDPEPIVKVMAEATFPAIGNGRRLAADLRATRARWSDLITARRGAAAHRLADLLIQHPVIDMPLVARELSLATSNAQHAIDRLVDDGVLRLIGKGARDRVWEAPEVISALDGFAKRAKRRLA